MLNKVLTTPVDDLVEYVKTHQNCSLTSLKTHLRLPLELIEKWLVILEEYNVLSVQYKGFEGFVKVKGEEVEKDKQKEIDIDQLKNTFIDKCKSKDLSYDAMKNLWPSFLQKYQKEIKDLFYKKAAGKGYTGKKIDFAWEKFRKALEVL